MSEPLDSSAALLDSMAGVQIVLPAGKEAPAQHLDPEILARSLRNRGHRACFVDSSPRDPAPALSSDPPASLVYWHLATISDLDEILDRKPPSVEQDRIHLLGGLVPGFYPEELLRRLPWAAGVVTGILEEVIPQVLEQARCGIVDFRSIPGLVVRSAETPVEPPPPGPQARSEAVLRAATDLIVPETRKQNGQKVLISRGCKSRCSYCGFGPHHRRQSGSSEGFWQPRDPGEIVEEIEHLHCHFGIDYFLFQAAVFFGYDREGSAQVEDVCRRILKKKLNIRFKLVTHPGHLLRNSDLLPLLKASGLDLIYLGLDSGSARSLERFQVEFTVADGLNAMDLLSRAEIPFTPGFVFYEPYMRLAEIGEQLRFLRRAQPYFAFMKPTFSYWLDKFFLSSKLQVKRFMPLSGRLEKDGLIRPADSVPWRPPEGFRFLHPETACFYRAHQRAKKTFLDPLRPVLWRRHCHKEVPQLSTLSLDLLDLVYESVRRRPLKPPELHLETAGDLARSTVQPAKSRLFAVADLSERQKLRIDQIGRTPA